MQGEVDANYYQGLNFQNNGRVHALTNKIGTPLKDPTTKMYTIFIQMTKQEQKFRERMKKCQAEAIYFSHGMYSVQWHVCKWQVPTYLSKVVCAYKITNAYNNSPRIQVI